MHGFTDVLPSRESYWRAIILFGRNVASYKFALGKSLLDLAGGKESFIPLEELATPYATHICEHLAQIDTQGTSPSSTFLDACRNYNSGSITKEALVATTVRLGFTNVLDAFHTVSGVQVPVRFFEVDDKGSARGLVVTDDLYRMREGSDLGGLKQEVESRWRLVERSWQLGVSRALLGVCHDVGSGLLSMGSGQTRSVVTSSRSALIGYQKGRCFYCFAPISVNPESPLLADVDHFFPFVLGARKQEFYPVNGIWNLVLACRACNRGRGGKSDRIPRLHFLERLHRRNEFLIASHHPLRETLMEQTGNTSQQRARFIQAFFFSARSVLPIDWATKPRGPEVF